MQPLNPFQIGIVERVSTLGDLLPVFGVASWKEKILIET